LNLDWVEGALADWHALLGQSEVEEESLKILPGVHPADAVKRVRVVLEQIYCANATGEPSEAACLYLEGRPLSQLASMLSDRAAEAGITFQSLWATLSEHWLSDDHADPSGFLEAGMRSREIIRTGR
jgi:hypothetical protein